MVLLSCNSSNPWAPGPIRQDVGQIAPSQQANFDINYVSSGDPTKPVVVFIHGTPGNWRSFASYLADETLQRQARLVSLDRPGWYGSVSPQSGKRKGIDFTVQSRHLYPLLKKLHKESDGQGLILVGHSLGASLAPQLAMHYPQLVNGLVLLSGTFDPELGKPRWYHRFASTWLVGRMIGGDLRHANREMLILRKQLEAMDNGWSKLNMPITVIQGMKDWLVNPDNATYLENKLVDQPQLQVIRLEKASHFIPWENRETITQAIQNMLQNL